MPERRTDIYKIFKNGSIQQIYPEMGPLINREQAQEVLKQFDFIGVRFTNDRDIDGKVVGHDWVFTPREKEREGVLAVVVRRRGDEKDYTSRILEFIEEKTDQEELKVAIWSDFYFE